MAQDLPSAMLRPRVKPEHAPYRIDGGRIRIGGASFGIAAEIADPDGWVWAMLSAMDGSRGLAEVVELARQAHPSQPADRLGGGARQLIGSGYVEDAAGPVPGTLTERDLCRYDRAAAYFRWLDLTPRAGSWEPQARLRAARVTVLGVGGTGGVAAMALAASGVGRLHCVDPDVVELSNLSRQVLYTEDDIGQPKADAAVARLRQLKGDIEITGQQTPPPAPRMSSSWPTTVTYSCWALTGPRGTRLDQPRLPEGRPPVGGRRGPRAAGPERGLHPRHRAVLGVHPAAVPGRPGRRQRRVGCPAARPDDRVPGRDGHRRLLRGYLPAHPRSGRSIRPDQSPAGGGCRPDDPRAPPAVHGVHADRCLLRAAGPVRVRHK